MKGFIFFANEILFVAQMEDFFGANEMRKSKAPCSMYHDDQIHVFTIKIENGNGECAKETTTRP